MFDVFLDLVILSYIHMSHLFTSPCPLKYNDMKALLMTEKLTFVIMGISFFYNVTNILEIFNVPVCISLARVFKPLVFRENCKYFISI